MISLILLALLSTSNAFWATPNTSECNQCISNINYFKTHNSSIVNMLNTIDNICSQLNFTECLDGVNYTEHAIQNINATQVCENLGFCDTLDLNNLELSISNVYLFRYYNSILGMNTSINFNHTKPVSNESYLLEFHQLWNITFEDPILNIKHFELDNYPMFKCPKGSWLYPCSKYGCGCTHDPTLARSCNIPSVSLLKVSTHNHMYYYNITDQYHPNFLGRIYFNQKQSILDYLSIYENPVISSSEQKLIMNFYNNQNYSIIDTIYNGTMYNILGHWEGNMESFNSFNMNMNLVKCGVSFS